MTAIDAYLARERETLRAATPRPWQVEISDGYITGHITAREHRYAGNRVSRKDSVTGPDSMTTRDAGLIVSAVNDREVLLDAVELLAELTRRVSTLMAKHEWDGWGPTSPNEIEEAYVGEFTSRARALLSRLTADSEGVRT